MQTGAHVRASRKFRISQKASSYSNGLLNTQQRPRSKGPCRTRQDHDTSTQLTWYVKAGATQNSLRCCEALPKSKARRAHLRNSDAAVGCWPPEPGNHSSSILENTTKYWINTKGSGHLTVASVLGNTPTYCINTKGLHPARRNLRTLRAHACFDA